MADKSCFVVMGYGQRRDPVSGKKVDLDRIYFEIIKPIAEERGYRCYRGDEVHDSGIIDVSMYYGILDADLVIADITTLNPNAVYELGVRHGVRKRKTIIMMEQSNKFFFDLNHVRTITYKYPRFGGIRQAEIEKTKSTLRDVVIYLDEHIEKDSPLYTYVEDLCEPQKKSNHSINSTGKTLYERVKEAIQFRNQMNYDNAVTCFGALNKEFPSDIFFLQQLALCTYKNQKPTKKEAYHSALTILSPILDTVDPETNGMAGSIYKRLYELDENQEYIEKAIETLEKAYTIFKDYYSGDNLAYCLNLKATKLEDMEEKEWLNAFARRIRKEIYEKNKEINPDQINSEEEIWLIATLADCCYALGREDADKYEKLFLSKANEFMQSTYFEQKAKLQNLLNI